MYKYYSANGRLEGPHCWNDTRIENMVQTGGESGLRAGYASCGYHEVCGGLAQVTCRYSVVWIHPCQCFTARPMYPFVWWLDASQTFAGERRLALIDQVAVRPEARS